MASKPYIVSALKHRPTTFAEVLAQDHVTRTLLHSLERGKIANAYLFVGPRGTGKTTTARILAKALNCTQTDSAEPCNQCDSCRAIVRGTSPDVLEIDAASNRGVKEMESLRENIRFAPSLSQFKIYIIDEVHMLTTEAHNAFLKTLEEPPAHAKFILATTELHKIPETILSRCQRFQFRRIPTQTIVDHLKQILASNDELDFSDPTELDKILFHLARTSEGGLRDALVLLDQLLAFCSGHLKLDEVQNILGVVEFDTLDRFFRAIFHEDLSEILLTIESIMNRGQDLGWFLKECLLFLRNLAVIKVSAKQSHLLDLPDDYIAQLQETIQHTTIEQILYITDIFWEAEKRMRFSSETRLILEMSAIKSAKASQAVKIDDLLKKISDGSLVLPAIPSAEMVQPSVSAQTSRPALKVAQEKITQDKIVPAITAPLEQATTVPPKTDGLHEVQSPTKAAEIVDDSDSLEIDSSAAETNTEPQAVAPPSANSPIKADSLYSSWQNIIKNDTLDPILSASLQNSVPIELNESIIRVAIPAQNSYMLPRLEQAYSQEILRNLLKDIFGKDYQIKFELKDDLVLSEPEIEEIKPAKVVVPELSRKEIMDKIQQNESVNKLMKEIPGQIVNIIHE